MANGNNVNVVGNCTREPELRFTPSGQAVATFGLAVNRRWQNRQTQEWEEAVSYFDVVCWGQLGENVSESVTKGTRLVVSGRLDQRNWETTEGEKRSKIEINAEEVGPSLRWATAQIAKNERRSDGAAGGTAGGGGFGGGSSSPTPAPAEPPAGYDYDEEPF